MTRETTSLPIHPPARDRPRVLIENAHPDVSSTQADALRHAGFEVVVCSGPIGESRDRCELVETGSCSLVETADVVLYDLDLDVARDRHILETAIATYPERRFVLEVPTAVARRHAELLQTCHVIPPFSTDALVDAVREEAAV